MLSDIGRNAPDVGSRLRALREAQGFSLRALARRSGLSLNAITRIESGHNSPTVSSLHLLAHALGVSIATFFESNALAVRTLLIPPAERLATTIDHILVESLGIGLSGQQLAPFALTLPPGAGTHEHPVSHPGEEFVYCLEGSLTYVIADQPYQLTPGTTLLFDSAQPHFFQNRSTEPVRFLLLFLGQGVQNRHATLHLHPPFSPSDTDT
jgi:transcriptional regulator with XRE-family HTH domain